MDAMPWAWGFARCRKRLDGGRSGPRRADASRMGCTVRAPLRDPHAAAVGHAEHARLVGVGAGAVALGRVGVATGDVAALAGARADGRAAPLAGAAAAATLAVLEPARALTRQRRRRRRGQARRRRLDVRWRAEVA